MRMLTYTPTPLHYCCSTCVYQGCQIPKHVRDRDQDSNSSGLGLVNPELFSVFGIGRDEQNENFWKIQNNRFFFNKKNNV